MIVVRPIRISSRARALWRERPGDRCIALQFREIRSGGCCSAGAAVLPWPGVGTEANSCATGVGVRLCGRVVYQ